MNKNVPTLLGIVIILLVVVLVIAIYNITLFSRLSAGQTPVGTVGGQVLTGVEPPTEEISPSEVMGAQVGKEPEVSPAQVQGKPGLSPEDRREREQRQERMKGQPAPAGPSQTRPATGRSASGP